MFRHKHQQLALVVDLENLRHKMNLIDCLYTIGIRVSIFVEHIILVFILKLVSLFNL